MSKFALLAAIARERGPVRTLAWLGLRLAKSLRIGFVAPPDPGQAALPAEVVYVATDKDLATLPRSIASLGLCRGVEVRSIVIIGPPGSQIENFAHERGLRFCSEVEVLGFGPEKYTYPIGSDGNRSGWLFQQMVKLGWAYKSNSPAYIVLDADTIILNPVSFINNGRYILYRSEEWRSSYAAAVQCVIGARDRSLLSFVAHMMIFESESVRQMLGEIEDAKSASWTDVIARTRSLDELSCFSEYQLYGCWMRQRRPDKVRSTPLYNRSVERATLQDPSRLAEMSRFCQTVSAHSYIAAQ